MQALTLQVVVSTMIIRPIDKHLLIHTIQYAESGASDGWNAGFSEPVTIEFVRVEPSSSFGRTTNSEGAKFKHIVFVDKVNSSLYPEFKQGSKITWNEQDFELAEVNPFYDVSPIPHHYELGLK